MSEVDKALLLATELQIRATILLRDLKSDDREAMKPSLFTNLGKMYDILGDIYKELPNGR
jgi:hypothetical protein